MEKLIITAAICGAEVGKEDNPHLPITAKELAMAALDAERAGASIIHLHVRDEQGKPSQQLRYFRAAFDAMKEAGVTAVIQPTTGGAAGMSGEERLLPVELAPEMASLDCGTMNFGDEVFINDLPLMKHFAGEMKSRGIVPELECFEPGHIQNAMRLAEQGLLPEHLHFNIVLGVPGAMEASVKNLLFMAELLPPQASWTASGMGRHQLPLAVQAVISGGHARVGFEDNIYYSKGILAESNAQLVARVARVARELGRDTASPKEARKILKICGKQEK